MIFFITVSVIPLMLIVAGLAIDLGALGVIRDRAQVAVDAAATAGASAIHFVKNDPTCISNCDGVWLLDTEIARQYAIQNGLPEPAITFDPSVPKVKVTGTASIGTSFLRLIGITHLDTSAAAVAIRTNVAQPDKDAEPPTPGRYRLTK